LEFFDTQFPDKEEIRTEIEKEAMTKEHDPHSLTDTYKIKLENLPCDTIALEVVVSSAATEIQAYQGDFKVEKISMPGKD